MPAPRDRLPLAVSMGDPAGIGLEVLLKSWSVRRERGVAPFVLYADPDAVAACARALAVPAELAIVPTPAEAAAQPGRLAVVPIELRALARPGQPDPANAAAIIAAIEGAAGAVMRKEALALVTLPISKSVLHAAGFRHPGHTEYLGALAELADPRRRYHPVMMLACDELRVVPLTVHIPLAEVPGRITRSLLFETIRTTWTALRSDFAIDAPRIAVTGLNPHAGEGGSLGREEAEVIAPAIRDLRAEGLAVTGPHPADTLFHATARGDYDAAVCMYHDQALIPIKTLAFDTGVNVTLGLPFVRTSPDHGTAFDIAGEGRASPESLLAAMAMAYQLGERRARTAAGAAR